MKEAEEAKSSMPRMLLTNMVLLGLSMGTLIFAGPADAQPNDSNISLSAPGLLPKKPGPGLPEVKPQPLAWPRLDPGAVICRTADDLEKLGARRHGQSVDGPVDCKIVRAATAISIVQRRGPGMTEVTASDPRTALSGWTDAWLPAKGTGAATSVAR